MRNPVARYTHWLHTRWPAGTVEKLPEVGVDGATSLPGVRIVGDLTGIPLLKFSADTGARAVQAILREPEFARARGNGNGHGDPIDLAIVGGGVSGIAAALEARFPGFRDALGARFAVAIDGEILQDAWHEPLAAGAELHFLPALSGGA